MNAIENMINEECANCGYEVCGDCFVKKAKEELKKRKWHDLRVDAKDLPTDERTVLVKAKMKCKWDGQFRLFLIEMTYCSEIKYGKPVGWGFGYPYCFDFETDEIVAWREVEQFVE